MKKRTFTLLLGWLLLLTSNLMAQNNEGRFNMKEGDWVEVEVEQNDCDNGVTKFLLKYQLIKQLQNKNQKYKVTLQRFKIINMHELEYYGYDSYYPVFDDNKTTREIKNQFSLEVSPEGKLISFTPFIKNNTLPKVLVPIKPSNGVNVYYSYSVDMKDSLNISKFTSTLMHPDNNIQKGDTTTVNKIPLVINQSNIQLRLSNASFPLPANAIIKGKLKDQTSQDIFISLIGEKADYFFPDKQFRMNNDGSFKCPIFLKRPSHLMINIDNKNLITFMESGDTLNISGIGNFENEIQSNHYIGKTANENNSSGKKNSEYYTGNASYNTILSNELPKYKQRLFNVKEKSEFVEIVKETQQAALQLIESYQGKASDQCIKYFKSDFQYVIAQAKLFFESSVQSPIVDGSGKITMPDKVNFPDNFFSEIDTLPILMIPFEWNSSYQDFIDKAQKYKMKRLGWSVRKTATDNFMENYFFSQVALKGYPLYQQLAYYIDIELRKGSEISFIQPYYEDFLNNCSDPSLTEPLIRNYEAAKQLKIGEPFPFNTFILKDNTIFDLKKFKGKPICLILIIDNFSTIKEYKEAISKFNNENIQFIIAKLPNTEWIDGKPDSTFSNIPNVINIELGNDELKSKLLLNRNKVFMLDKWFRIVENNAEDPMTNKYMGSESKFEKSIRKIIDAKRYSKAEKSAFLKTAGWSLGSILFTLLVGWWIYRMRIRQIKRQEEAKRRIKELEIKAIRSQMNPHFIFNSLNSIQSLINSNQFKEANIYLSKFAVLLRGVLNNSEKSRISLSDELQAVELYCQLEQLRFDFNFDITIDENINGDLIEIPGMIIQPLAENAVVHGISAKGNQGKLSIQVSRQNQNVCIKVTDNGIGLAPQVIDTLSQKGFGLKLVEERINILNLDGKEARLTLRNLENNAGTLATLIIPID